MGTAEPVDDAGDERTLVAEAQAGSGTALNALLTRSAPLLNAYLQRQIGRTLQRYTSLDDIRQDAMLRAVGGLKHLPQGATIEDFQAILFRNARWSILSAARRGADTVFESAILPKGGGFEVPAPQGSHGTVTRADEHERIRTIVEALDEPFATVARMRMEGATFAAIGDAQGITEEAARKRFQVASEKLRGRLGRTLPKER